MKDFIKCLVESAQGKHDGTDIIAAWWLIGLSFLAGSLLFLLLPALLKGWLIGLATPFVFRQIKKLVAFAKKVKKAVDKLEELQ